MPEDNNFSSNFVEIAKKYGPAAIAAALLGTTAGGVNTYLAAKTKPANETAKQRRHRLLRSFLLPAVTAGGGALALSGLIPLMKLDPKSKDEIYLDKMSEPPALENIATNAANTASGYVLPIAAAGLGGIAGKRLIGDSTVAAMRAGGPLARATVRGVTRNRFVKGITNLLSKSRKTRFLSKLVRGATPYKTNLHPENFEKYTAPLVKAIPTTGGAIGGAALEGSGENLIRNLIFGENRPKITQEQLDAYKASEALKNIVNK